MAKFNLPELEDEENDAESTSPLAEEVAQQHALTTDSPNFDVNGSAEPKLDEEMDASDEIQDQAAELLGRMGSEDSSPMHASVQAPTSPQAAAVMAASAAPQASVPKSLLDRYSELKGLQDKQRETVNNLGYLQAGNQIAQGIARGHGGQIGDGSEAVKMLKEDAGLPVKQYLQRQEDALTQNKMETSDLTLGNEKELNDKNSSVSKFAQNQAKAILKKLNPAISDEELSKIDNLTGKQIQKLPGLSSALSPSLMTANMQSDYETVTGQPLSFNKITNQYSNIITGEPYKGEVRRKVINQFIDPVTGQMVLRDRTNLMPLGQTLDVSKSEPTKDITRTDLNPKQKDLLDKTREDLSKNKQYQSSQEAIDGSENALALLQSGKDTGEDLVRAIQTMLAKSSGQVGVLTEQDVAGFNGRADVLSRLQRYVTVAAQGKLPEEDRAFLMKYAQAMNNAAKRNVDQINYQFSKQLSDDLGVKLNQSAGLLNASDRLAPKALSEELSSKKDSKVDDYAKQNSLTYEQAKKLLMNRGYKPNEQ